MPPLVLDGTNGVSGVDGTASNPAIEGTDSNTGIFYPAADTVAIGTGGTEALRVNSSQNVGIGTSSPNIQTWRSGTYLTVANASTRGQIEIDGAVADSSSANLGALIFTYSTNTTNHKDVALIEAISSGATANQRGGVLNFYTKANGTAAPALNMTLDASGNLGIGTGSPTAKLTVSGTTILGTGTWPTGSAGLSDSRAGVMSPTENGQFLVVNTNGTVAANNGGEILLGATATTSTADAALARIGGYKENATSGNFASYLAFKTTNSTGTAFERARIAADGKVSIGGSTENAVKLQIIGEGNTNSTFSIYCRSSANTARFAAGDGGTVYATATTISSISDQRLKENIVTLDVGLAEIMALQPRKFDWKEGQGKDIKGDRGFIAQEFEQVFPELIDEWIDAAPEGEEPYKSVRQDLIPVLVKAIQEQQAMIEEMKAEIAVLKGNA